MAAVSAYPGGHAESYASQKLWSGDHHGGYGGEHGGYIISGYNAGHDGHDDGHHQHVTLRNITSESLNLIEYLSFN